MTQRSFEISTDPTRLNVPFIHRYLSASYWAKGISIEVVQRSIENSLCFGSYVPNDSGSIQVGFARVITYFATFAYLAGVFVADEHQGQGVGEGLIYAVMEHPRLQGMRRFLLITKNAHRLYAKSGFEPIPDADQYLAIRLPSASAQR